MPSPLRAATKPPASPTMTTFPLVLEPLASATPAGSIRRQRESRQTGFGMIREKSKNFINNDILPHYLEFAWVERDDEAMASIGRARLLNANAFKAMAEANFITPDDGQEQLKQITRDWKFREAMIVSLKK